MRVRARAHVAQTSLNESIAAAQRHTPLPRTDTRTAQVLSGHRIAVNAIDFCRLHLLLATGSSDKTVRLWHKDDNAAEWLCTHVVRLPFPVTSVGFDPDGTSMAVSCTGDDRAYVWDVVKMADYLSPWDYQVRIEISHADSHSLSHENTKKYARACTHCLSLAVSLSLSPSRTHSFSLSFSLLQLPLHLNSPVLLVSSYPLLPSSFTASLSAHDTCVRVIRACSI